MPFLVVSSKRRRFSLLRIGWSTIQLRPFSSLLILCFWDSCNFILTFHFSLGSLTSRAFLSALYLWFMIILISFVIQGKLSIRIFICLNDACSYFCEEDIPRVVSISWVLEDFKDLKRCPVDVSLEFSFIKLPVVSNGDYFRRICWDARCQSCINHIGVRTAQTCRDHRIDFGIVGYRCRSFYNILHFILLEYFCHLVSFIGYLNISIL